MSISRRLFLAALCAAILTSASARGASRLFEITLNDSPVADVQFSPDGRLLAISSWDTESGSKAGRVWIYDVAARKVVRDAQVEAGTIAFTPDGKTLALGTHGLGVLLYDVATMELRAHLDKEKVHRGRPETGMPGWYRVVAITPNGRYLLAFVPKVIEVWDLIEGQRKAVIDEELEGADGVVVPTPDSKQFLFASPSHVVERRNLPDGSLSGTLPSIGGIGRIVLSADGRRIVSSEGLSTGKPSLRVWDAATGRQVAAIRFGGKSVDRMAISPDGRYVVGTGEYMQAHLWPIDDPDDDDTLPGHRDVGMRRGTTAVAFSPDGKLIAVGGADGTVIVFPGPSDGVAGPAAATSSPAAFAVPAAGVTDRPPASAAEAATAPATGTTAAASPSAGSKSKRKK